MGKSPSKIVFVFSRPSTFSRPKHGVEKFVSKTDRSRYRLCWEMIYANQSCDVFVMCSCLPFATYTTTRGDILTFRYVGVLYICDDLPR